jgi:hypothetical protein
MPRTIRIDMTSATDVVEGAAALLALANNIRKGVEEANDPKVVVPAKDMLKCAVMLEHAGNLIEKLTLKLENGEAPFGVIPPSERKGII